MDTAKHPPTQEHTISKNTKKPRIQLDTELIADLEATGDTDAVRGGGKTRQGVAAAEPKPGTQTC